MSKSLFLLRSRPKNVAAFQNRDNDDHFVYIMAHLNEDTGWIEGPTKVGISKDPTKRLKQVQAVESGRIVLVAQFGFWKREHAYWVEQTFHRVCSHYRARGEWFDIAPVHVVALMNINLQTFASEYLGADDTQDDFTNFDYLNVPGALFDIDTHSFEYPR